MPLLPRDMFDVDIDYWFTVIVVTLRFVME